MKVVRGAVRAVVTAVAAVVVLGGVFWVAGGAFRGVPADTGAEASASAEPSPGSVAVGSGGVVPSPEAYDGQGSEVSRQPEVELRAEEFGIGTEVEDMEHVTGVEEDEADGELVRTVISTDLGRGEDSQETAKQLVAAYMQELAAECVEDYPQVEVTSKYGTPVPMDGNLAIATVSVSDCGLDGQ